MPGLIDSLLRRALSRAYPCTPARTAANDASLAITNEGTLDAFRSNPENTFLVSFPRTGSHWLRMLMELYFGRPSLTRVFYYPDRTDYLTLHTHDLELDEIRSNVLYLYRDPVDTIYSQLQYHNEDIDSREQIAKWSDHYGRHLDKWLHRETFSTRKTIIRYEALGEDIEGEFGKVCEHFNTSLDVERLGSAVGRVTKQTVTAKTPHDPQVMNLSGDYQDERDRFRIAHADLVWQVLLDGREQLRNDFRCA